MKRQAYLALLGAAVVIAQAVAPASAAGDARHPLTRALDNHANVTLLATLQPNNRQLLDALTVARGARQIMTQYDDSRQQAAAAAANLFKQQIQSFSGGQPLDAATAQAITTYHQAEAERRVKMLGAVDAQVRKLRQALAPEQARLIDWSRPPEASGLADNQVVLDELRQLMAAVNEAGRMLERIRYLIASDYMTSRIGRVNEYLRGYIRPNTPEFDAARDWMLTLLSEVRQVPEDDWPQQATLYAGRVLQYLGVLEPQERRQAQARYNWWDVYYLLTDPQTPDMLQQMLAARGGAAE